MQESWKYLADNNTLLTLASESFIIGNITFCRKLFYVKLYMYHRVIFF